MNGRKNECDFELSALAMNKFQLESIIGFSIGCYFSILRSLRPQINCNWTLGVDYN